jgi:hypothetical protein
MSDLLITGFIPSPSQIFQGLSRTFLHNFQGVSRTQKINLQIFSDCGCTVLPHICTCTCRYHFLSNVMHLIYFTIVNLSSHNNDSW